MVSSCPGTHTEDRAEFKLTEIHQPLPPPSAGLKVCVTTALHLWFFYAGSHVQQSHRKQLLILLPFVPSNHSSMFSQGTALC